MTNRVLLIKMFPHDGLSSANQRMYGLVSGLVRAGFKIDLLTVPSNEELVKRDLTKIPFYGQIHVYYACAKPRPINSKKGSYLKQSFIKLLKNLYHKFSLFDRSLGVSKSVSLKCLPTQKYDLVIPISDPKTSYVCLNSLIKQGLLFDGCVEYWGDPLFGDISSQSILPSFYKKKVESEFLRLADLIVYTSPFTLERQRQIYKKFSNKMIFVPTPAIKPILYPACQNNVFMIGYFGAYESHIRDIMPLYKACEALGKEVFLTVVGNSDLKLENKDNIEIRGRMDVNELEKNADLLICLLNKKGTQIPGKLYFNAATNKRVLVIVDGDRQDEMIEFLKKFDRFYICHNDFSSIVESLIKIKVENQEPVPSPCVDSLSVVETILKELRCRKNEQKR